MPDDPMLHTRLLYRTVVDPRALPPWCVVPQLRYSCAANVPSVTLDDLGLRTFLQ